MSLRRHGGDINWADTQARRFHDAPVSPGPLRIRTAPIPGLNLPAPLGAPAAHRLHRGMHDRAVGFSAAADGRVRMGFAGDTYNTCVYLARLMGRGHRRGRVSYVTALGDDGLSERMIAPCGRKDFSSAHVRAVAGRLPGLYAIELEEGAANGQVPLLARPVPPRGDMFGSGGLSMEGARRFRRDLIFRVSPFAILPEPAREDLADACAAARRRGGSPCSDSNYRPRLWPGADAAARRSSGPARHRARPALAGRRGHAPSQRDARGCLRAPCGSPAWPRWR